MTNLLFHPSEIIFASTSDCNLRCQHCFTTHTHSQLKIDDAIALLESAVKESGGMLDRIGFSGGEPFLYIDFITRVSEAAVKNDLLFDRIMTNGDFWTNPDDLKQKLDEVYNSGFDGKIGLSFDAFHGQDTERIAAFIQAIYDTWHDGSMVEIQSVVKKTEKKPSGTETITDCFEQKFSDLAEIFEASIEKTIDPFTGCGIITLENNRMFLPVQRTPQSFLPDDNSSWKSKAWFKDDFCEGPGQILFVHPTGQIAPCCGFANEAEPLCIGKITDSWNTILENAKNNRFVNTCYSTGLGEWRKSEEKKGRKFPGITDDMCMFCAYACHDFQ